MKKANRFAICKNSFKISIDDSVRREPQVTDRGGPFRQDRVGSTLGFASIQVNLSSLPAATKPTTAPKTINVVSSSQRPIRSDRPAAPATAASAFASRRDESGIARCLRGLNSDAPSLEVPMPAL
jgi:hypothetical protein